MVIQFQGLPSILPDNDSSYFNLLRATIDSMDPAASMSITKGSTGYVFRLLPSGSIYIDGLIRQLTEMNTLMGIQLEFSKSVKSSSVISWKLSF